MVHPADIANMTVPELKQFLQEHNYSLASVQPSGGRPRPVKADFQLAAGQVLELENLRSEIAPVPVAPIARGKQGGAKGPIKQVKRRSSLPDPASESIPFAKAARPELDRTRKDLGKGVLQPPSLTRKNAAETITNAPTSAAFSDAANNVPLVVNAAKEKVSSKKDAVLTAARRFQLYPVLCRVLYTLLIAAAIIFISLGVIIVLTAHWDDLRAGVERLTGTRKSSPLEKLEALHK